MSHLPRPSGLLPCLGLLAALAFGAPAVHGFQVMNLTGPPDGSDAVVSDPVTLPIDRQARKKLNTARDYIKDESWPEAVRLLQAILDAPEDGFLPQKSGDAKDPTAQRWVSARAEAERVLAALPPAGLEFYQLTYDAGARRMLKMARDRNDLQGVAEVVRRFGYTGAGAEAIAFLGNYHLDRGRADLAAACFQRLLQRPEGDKLPVMTLFQATVAFHSVGDATREGQAWQKLAKRIGAEGVKIGDKALSAEELRKEIDHWPAASGRSADWPLYRGDARRTALSTGAAPYLKSRWRQSTGANSEGRAWLEQAVQAGPQPNASLPGAVPITAGGKLVYRGLDGIHALDLANGKEAWRTPSPLGLEALLREPGSRVQLQAWFASYGPARGILFENSALGTLSSDGRKVFAVEDLALPPPSELTMRKEQGRPWPFGPLKDAVVHNRLRALDVETGVVAWDVGGPWPTVRGELANCYFLGPPLPMAGQLFALIEKDQDLRLVCLGPEHGEVLWVQTLASARDKILYDAGRRAQAAPLAFGEGLLVCPTNTGAILAVDPLTRSLVWAHTYRPKSPAPAYGGMPAFNPYVYTTSWKATAPIVQDGKVLFTAPDSDSLRCLNLRDGSLAWKVTRTEDDLYLAGVFDGKVLVVGKGACRAFGLANGEPLWQVRTGLPSGQGVVGGKTYYLPLRADPNETVRHAFTSADQGPRARGRLRTQPGRAAEIDRHHVPRSRNTGQLTLSRGRPVVAKPHFGNGLFPPERSTRRH